MRNITLINMKDNSKNKKWVLLTILLLMRQSLFSEELMSPAVIGKITINSRDIFNPQNPLESRWPYRFANFLHIQTHEKVIKRELLFKEGDIYNAALIAETERNLRSFSFLRHVHIEETRQPDNTVDLNVNTNDTWTLEPQANFKRVGGKNTAKIGVVERNLLGTGKKISLLYEGGQNSIHRTFAYRDLQFLGRPLTFEGSDVSGPDLRVYGVAISKPFRSTKSRYSLGASSFFTQEEIGVFSSGNEVGKFEIKNRESKIDYGRSLGRSPFLIRRALFSFRQQNRSYSHLVGDTQGLIKPDLFLTVGEVGMQIQKEEFIKERHINKFDRDEDFNLGAGGTFLLGVGQNWDASKRVEILPRLEAQKGINWGPGQFTLLKSIYRSRISNDTTDDLLWTLNLQSFHRLQPNNTLAMNIAYDHGYRLDPENYLLLGEDTGLRGYPIGQFSGDRRFLLNLEDRLFFVDDWLSMFSLGAAAFYDAGYAWQPSETIGITDLRHSVGLGLRLAFSRSSRNEPIRIDFAYALNNNDKSSQDRNSRLVFSVQSGVKFGGDPDVSSRSISR